LTFTATGEIVFTGFTSCTALETDASGNLTCGTDAEGTGGTSYWTQGEGILYPMNATVDILIGGTATATADFAFTNIAGGTPTLYAPNAAAIDFPEFDVSGDTGSITIEDGGDAGQLSVQGTVLDIDSLTFVGSGTVASTTNTLTLDSGDNTLTICNRYSPFCNRSCNDRCSGNFGH